MAKSEEDIFLKRHELILQEISNEDHFVYMSFCDPDLTKGKQFLGAIIVESQGVASAHQKINMLGINPGGEIQFTEVPFDGLASPNAYSLFKNNINKLMSKNELKDLGFID